MPDETIIVQLEANAELMKCVEFLTLSEQGLSKIAIAEHFGIARSTLYEWIVLWDKAGILERARSIVLVPKAEEIASAVDRVVTAWSKVIDRQLDVALNSPNEANANRSADWLLTNVIRPTMDKRERPGAQEMEYLSLQGESPVSPLLVAGEDSQLTD